MVGKDPNDTQVLEYRNSRQRERVQRNHRKNLRDGDRQHSGYHGFLSSELSFLLGYLSYLPPYIIVNLYL